MCRACRSSAMGLERQANLDAARSALREVGLVPTPASTFFARPGVRRPGAPGSTAQQQKTWDNYLAAVTALRRLHEDFVRTQRRTPEGGGDEGHGDG